MPIPWCCCLWMYTSVLSLIWFVSNLCECYQENLCCCFVWCLNFYVCWLSTAALWLPRIAYCVIYAWFSFWNQIYCCTLFGFALLMFESQIRQTYVSASPWRFNLYYLSINLKISLDVLNTLRFLFYITELRPHSNVCQRYGPISFSKYEVLHVRQPLN